MREPELYDGTGWRGSEHGVKNTCLAEFSWLTHLSGFLGHRNYNE